jgi:hypothetical protein
MTAAGAGGDEPRLPRAGQAVVPVEKLHAYALDPEHRSGRHKARVFSSVLGIEQRDWEYLREQILARVAESPVTAIRPPTALGH